MDFLPILFIAGIAIFFAVKLYDVLGKPTGRSPEEHAASKPQGARRETGEAPLAPARPAASPAYSGPAGEGLAEIAEADQSFDPDEFLKGARQAYAMVLDAFAKGDRETLENLLAPRVYKRYAEAIDQRESRGESQVTELERIRDAGLYEASLNGDKAKVKVRFVAELANETRDSDGRVIAGDLSKLDTVSEIWSFERDVTDPDPNWKLTGVKPAED